MGDHITHSCSRVKETDLLISTSTDSDDPLIPQAPRWNLPHLHVLTVSCLTLHRRWKTQESTLLWPSWDTSTGGTTCYKLSVFVGAMSWLFSGLLCQRNKSKGCSSGCWSIAPLLIPIGCHLTENLFLPLWHLRTMVPAWITSKDPHFLTAPDSAFVQSCLFCVGEISHQNWNFLELFLFFILPYQGKKSIYHKFFFHMLETFPLVKWFFFFSLSWPRL